MQGQTMTNQVKISRLSLSATKRLHLRYMYDNDKERIRKLWILSSTNLELIKSIAEATLEVDCKKKIRCDFVMDVLHRDMDAILLHPGYRYDELELISSLNQWVEERK